jgi:hypothetical protein
LVSTLSFGIIQLVKPIQELLNLGYFYLLGFANRKNAILLEIGPQNNLPFDAFGTCLIYHRQKHQEVTIQL